MYETYKDHVQFYLVYMKEAHSSVVSNQSGGKFVEQPKSYEERCKVAMDFVKEMNLAIPTLVDSFDNKAGNDWSARPDRIYVIGKDGKIFYKAERGPDGFKPDEAAAALKKMLGN